MKLTIWQLLFWLRGDISTETYQPIHLQHLLWILILDFESHSSTVFLKQLFTLPFRGNAPLDRTAPISSSKLVLIYFINALLLWFLMLVWLEIMFLHFGIPITTFRYICFLCCLTLTPFDRYHLSNSFLFDLFAFFNFEPGECILTFFIIFKILERERVQNCLKESNSRIFDFLLFFNLRKSARLLLVIFIKDLNLPYVVQFEKDLFCRSFNLVLLCVFAEWVI